MGGGDIWRPNPHPLAPASGREEGVLLVMGHSTLLTLYDLRWLVRA